MTIKTLLTNEIANDSHAKAISASWALFVFAARVGDLLVPTDYPQTHWWGSLLQGRWMHWSKPRGLFKGPQECVQVLTCSLNTKEGLPTPPPSLSSNCLEGFVQLCISEGPSRQSASKGAGDFHGFSPWKPQSPGAGIHKSTLM